MMERDGLTFTQLIGIATFFLMIRGSMLQGWWHLFKNPRTFGRRPTLTDDDFITVESPKRRSSGRPLESEKVPTIETMLSGTTVAYTVHPSQNQAMMSPVSPVSPVSPIEPGILPEPTSPNNSRNPSVPQAGDVTKRHETINWFDLDYLEADKRESKRVSKLDDIA